MFNFNYYETVRDIYLISLEKTGRLEAVSCKTRGHGKKGQFASVLIWKEYGCVDWWRTRSSLSGARLGFADGLVLPGAVERPGVRLVVRWLAGWCSLRKSSAGLGGVSYCQVLHDGTHLRTFLGIQQRHHTQ